MLGIGYFTYNGLKTPNPVEMNIDFANSENENESEDGHVLTYVIRLQRRTFSCTFDCSSKWKDLFLAMCKTTSGTLNFLDEDIPVKARINSCQLVQNSEKLRLTDGLWTLSVTFSEE